MTYEKQRSSDPRILPLHELIHPPFLSFDRRPLFLRGEPLDSLKGCEGGSELA